MHPLPDLSALSLLGAPLVLLGVLWLGCALVPRGARLNPAGQVMLTAIALGLSGRLALGLSGLPEITMLSDWTRPTAMLLMVLCGSTMLAGGFLRLRGDRGWLVQLVAGALLAGAGAAGLKGLEVMAFAHNDFALASVSAPMSRVAMGIAGLYLLGALLVATRMPRRLAPLSAVLAVLGLVAWISSRGVTVSANDLTWEPVLLEQPEPGTERAWPIYHAHVLTVIDVTLAE
jgi:hypothetical protein